MKISKVFEDKNSQYKTREGYVVIDSDITDMGLIESFINIGQKSMIKYAADHGWKIDVDTDFFVKYVDVLDSYSGTGYFVLLALRK